MPSMHQVFCLMWWESQSQIGPTIVVKDALLEEEADFVSTGHEIFIISPFLKQGRHGHESMAVFFALGPAGILHPEIKPPTLIIEELVIQMERLASIRQIRGKHPVIAMQWS